MSDGLTMTQLKTELRPEFEEVLRNALAAWEPKAPALPAKTAQEYPKFLDVTIDGQKRKAELLDPKEGVYAAQVQMGQGLAGLVEAGDGLRILNVSLPLASVAVGFIGGMVVGNVLDVVVPVKPDGNDPTKTDMVSLAMNLGANGVAAWGIMRYGPGLVGSTASKFAVGVIIFRVLMRILPIQEWIDGLTGLIPQPVLGSTRMRQLSAGQGYEQQGSSVQSEVYRGTI